MGLCAALLVGACSDRTPRERASAQSPEPRRLTPPPNGALVLGCSDSLGRAGRPGAGDLVLGPLRYAGAVALQSMTPSSYLGATPVPDALGYYYYKLGAVVAAGHVVDVAMDPTGRIKIVGPSGTTLAARSVRYQACPSRDTVWVGGFATMGSPTACSSLTYRVDGAHWLSAKLDLFAGPC